MRSATLMLHVSRRGKPAMRSGFVGCPLSFCELVKLVGVRDRYNFGAFASVRRTPGTSGLPVLNDINLLATWESCHAKPRNRVIPQKHAVLALRASEGINRSLRDPSL